MSFAMNQPLGLPRSAVWMLFASALALAGCSRPQHVSSAPRAVVVMSVPAGDAQHAQLYSGEVRARLEGDLAFRVAGKIIERRVDAGQSVKKGQLLARIDAQDSSLNASAAEDAVRVAEADLNLAKAELQRSESLFAQHFVSASALDTRRSQLQSAQARLQQAQAQAAVSKNQLGYTSLYADRDGVVTAMNVEAGQVVAAGQAVLRLADPSSREALIWVPESRVASIKIGDAALVRPWSAQDQTLPGKVREIAGSADSTTRTYAVRIAVSGADARMPLGSTVAAAFVKDAAAAKAAGTAEIRLPLPAVLRVGERSLVWVLDKDNKAQQREVKVSAYRDTDALIGSGLQPGEQVVVVGAHTVQAGMALKPVEQSAPVALDVLR
ncbi:efflux RND transporter periplasmic adaptor subunit [Uliginosibacterium sediminicola]